MWCWARGLSSFCNGCGDGNIRCNGRGKQGKEALSVCAQGLCKDAKPIKHTQTLALRKARGIVRKISLMVQMGSNPYHCWLGLIEQQNLTLFRGRAWMPEVERPRALSTDAYKWSQKVGMQGCIKSVTQSRYARMHKDSHTKPLHDATAQMAVDAQMQRHK